MNTINIKILENNCAGDKSIMREILSMGLDRINESLNEIPTAYHENKWEEFARSVHKLRPILNFCGIMVIDTELLDIEQETKLKRKVPDTDTVIRKIIQVLENAQQDINNMLNTSFSDQN